MPPDPKQRKEIANLWQIKLAEISPSIFAFIQNVQELAEPITKMAETMEGILLPLSKLTTPYLETFSKIGQIFELSRQLNKSGWLPHHTTPPNLIQGTPEDISFALENYYKQNWPNVRLAIENKISSYDLDYESKAVIAEILNSHESGHYRSVCRTIFPEIERLSRLEFGADNQFKPLSSQKNIRELAGKLPARGGLEAIAMFERLYDHIYKEIKTVDALQEAKNDPVPNRHACLHGLVIYDTHQSSLNAIFFIEYIFWLYNYAKNLHKPESENVSSDLWE